MTNLNEENVKAFKESVERCRSKNAVTQSQAGYPFDLQENYLKSFQEFLVEDPVSQTSCILINTCFGKMAITDLKSNKENNCTFVIHTSAEVTKYLTEKGVSLSDINAIFTTMGIYL